MSQRYSVREHRVDEGIGVDRSAESDSTYLKHFRSCRPTVMALLSDFNVRRDEWLQVSNLLKTFNLGKAETPDQIIGSPDFLPARHLMYHHGRLYYLVQARGNTLFCLDSPGSQFLRPRRLR